MNSPDIHLSPRLRQLLNAPSLTAEFGRHPSAVFSVRLNFLGMSHLGADEADFFPQRTVGDAVFSREVCLCLDGEAVVSARSICLPEAAYWQSVLDCGTQSLGAQLFGGSITALTRGPFHFATLPTTHRLIHGFATMAAPARHSLFATHGENLLLTECFLPPLQHYGY